MKKPRAVSVLFYLAALYDGVFGVAFLVAAPALFDWVGVTPPNHFGYIHFPAALLIVFALLFLSIARRPEINRHLIPYGILLKISYCAVVFYHWFTAGIPFIWKPFAIADLVFLVVFIWAYAELGKQRSPVVET
ncbi:MAG: hypothetical protein V3T20_04120 [Gemmatimonadota bacterium]